MPRGVYRDLTGVLTGNKLGLDDLTGNQHLSISSSKHNGTAQETTLTGSTIGSSAGNVSLSAGRELKVVASDLVSTRHMALSGADVTITAGAETARQTTEDSAKSLAVGRVIGGAVVDTGRSIYDATEAAKNADDPRLKAVKIAQAALAAYNLGGQASEANGQSAGFKNKQGGTPSNGSLIKIGTELANTRSKASSEYNSVTARQSTLNAGQNLSIVATGDAPGSQGNLEITGSSLKAANTLLLAKNTVLLQSAQDTMDRKNDGSTNKTAIGASFNIGEQNGFTLDLGAQGAKNRGNGHSVTQVNTTLDTGSLLLKSGADTTLAGAQVRADSIKADIGGNLNILSRQDTESARSKQNSAGFGASICVPPFCFGSTVTGSASIAAAKMNSDYKAVTDQTGLFAGTGGYDINVGKTTTLQGGVIASEAAAVKNRLSTDRLIVSDIKNTSQIQSQSAGLSASFSSNGGFSPGGSIPVALKDDERSHTRSAVSDGTIEVRNPEGANDLVGLNRDTANANQQLDRPDQKAMQERIDLIQSSAQLASGVIGAVAKAKANEAKKLADEAKLQAGSPGAAAAAEAARVANAEALRWQVGGDKKLMADIATGLIAAGLGGATGGTAVGIVANTSSSDIFNKIGDFANAQRDKSSDATTKAAWAEGGAARILLHALAGAAMGLSSGSAQSGALGAGTSAAVMPSIAKALADSDLSAADQKAITSLIATGVGSVVGSGDGVKGGVVAGGTAFAVDKYNRQLHPQEKALALELAKKSNGKYTAEQIEAQMRLSFVKGTDITPGTDMVASGTGIYDPDGNWMATGDGKTYVQLPGKSDYQVIAYIKENTQAYAWTMEAESGFSRVLTGGEYAYPDGGSGKRDRLTGYPLDEKGGYKVPVTIEGVLYTPRFMSCGSAECIAVGANIDLADPNTLKWIKAADAKMVSDVGFVLGAGAAVTTGGVSAGLSNTSMAASFLSGYLKEELPEAATGNALSMGFEKFAMAKGVTPETASRLSNALGTAGVWDKLVEGLKGAVKGG